MSDDHDQIFDSPFKEPRPYEIKECAQTIRIFNIHINQEIVECHRYVEVLEKLRLAQPSDVVYLYLNTPGGYVDTGIQLIHAINDCMARVIAVLDGTVCSMGSLLFLAADEFIVHDYSRLMFHNYSGGVYGKGHEQISHLNSTTEWYTKLFVDLCIPFLSNDEAMDVINGQDLWLNADEVRARLDTMVKIVNEDHERLQEEIMRKQEKEVLARIAKREKAEKRKKMKPKKESGTKS